MSAVTQPSVRLYTAEDLLSLPEEARYELIEGELCEMPPPPGYIHGTRTERLSARASVYAEDHGLGECTTSETGYLIARSPDTVLAPDWAFVARERLPSEEPEGYLPVVPDIVLETRSPSDRSGKVAKKVARWLQAGARIVWELDPVRRTLTVHRSGVMPQVLGVEDTLIGEEVLPGFELPLRRVLQHGTG